MEAHLLRYSPDFAQSGSTLADISTGHRVANAWDHREVLGPSLVRTPAGWGCPIRPAAGSSIRVLSTAHHIAAYSY
eukprot:3938387-Rhodomonas_salina.2